MDASPRKKRANVEKRRVITIFQKSINTYIIVENFKKLYQHFKSSHI